jgi:hypothetical protein
MSLYEKKIQLCLDYVRVDHLSNKHGTMWIVWSIETIVDWSVEVKPLNNPMYNYMYNYNLVQTTFDS